MFLTRAKPFSFLWLSGLRILSRCHFHCDCTHDSYAASHTPHGVRGLKSLAAKNQSLLRGSHPLQGALVEIHWRKASSRTHRSLKVTLKNSDKIPSSVGDYCIETEPLSGLEPEVIDGI